MPDTKGDPIPGQVTWNDTRTVRIKLSNCSRTVDPLTGYTLIPDGLFIEWRNGGLTHCTLVGPRIRVDGGTYLDDRRAGRSFTRRKYAPYVLDDDTPTWVRELVNQYSPVGDLAIP